MSIQPIFIILVDISGYTNFIKLHKMSLLHAEKNIGELMESLKSYRESDLAASIPAAYKLIEPPDIEIFEGLFHLRD